MSSDDEKLDFGPWAIGTLALVIASLAVCIYAAQFRDGWGAFGIGGLIFLSAAMIGSLLGFIFAVPRVVAQDNGATAADAAPPSGDLKARVLSTNTNLERISDWLSTMLVGVGLSQLSSINGLLFSFREFLNDTARVYDLNGKASAGMLPAIGPLILILGAASGFLFMYLVTRLVLVRFFQDSEETIRGRAAAAVRLGIAMTQVAAKAASPTPASAVTAPSTTAPSPAPLPTGSTLPSSPAFERAAQGRPLSVEDTLEVIFELLYTEGGYRGVIQMSVELSKGPISKQPEYWLYLAAAFGQQLKTVAEGSADFSSIREKVLDAARRAVRIDKSFRARLWQISDPNGVDDDLSLLRADPEFLKLVGR